MVQINLFIKQKQSHSYKKETYGYLGVKVGMDKLEDCD